MIKPEDDIERMLADDLHELDEVRTVPVRERQATSDRSYPASTEMVVYRLHLWRYVHARRSGNVY